MAKRRITNRKNDSTIFLPSHNHSIIPKRWSLTCLVLIILGHSTCYGEDATTTTDESSADIQSLHNQLNPPYDRPISKNANATPCESMEDLDFEDCDIPHLPIATLSAICDELGLDVYQQVFPYMFFKDDEELDGYDATAPNVNANVNDAKQDSETSAVYIPPPETFGLDREYAHSDYVEAAYVCLTIEDDMEDLMTEDPEALSKLESDLLQTDPEFLGDVVMDVLLTHPHLVLELEQQLKVEDPALYAELLEAARKSKLEDGEEVVGDISFADNPKLVAELVTTMIKEDPELLNSLDLLGYNDDDDDEALGLDDNPALFGVAKGKVADPEPEL